MLYVANITNMAGFISIIFSCNLLFGFHGIILYSTKIRINIIESSFCILGVIAEYKDNSRVEIILEKIGLLLEFDR